jgi:predicted nucleic acid-binding Zn ribbon protein
MRRTEIQSIGSVIKDYLKEKNFDKKLAEVDIVSSWESIVGRPIARATSSVALKDGTLHLIMKSSIVRHELLMMKSDLMRVINERAGFEIVTGIILK